MSVKRQLSLSRDSDVEIKNLRTTIDNQNSSMICFENLSNEIHYEIFDYLDGCCIYQAFSNLNSRFQQLITSSSLLLKILLKDDEYQFDLEYWCRNVIFPNKHRIISLHLSNSQVTDDFYMQCATDSSFIRLESINFYELSPSILIAILPYLKSLPRLFTMTIHLNNDSYIDFEEIYQMILHLPTLKYISLSLDQEDELHILALIVIKERFSTIESLIINHACTLGGLISLLYYTPQLKYLSCQYLFESDDNNENEIEIRLPHLTHFIVRYCQVEFIEFEKFMKKICLQLKVLRIRQFLNRNYSDPNRWKQLILQSMPHLCRFTVKCFVSVDDNFKNLHLNTFIHQFTSQFWFDRGWNFELKIIPEKVFYLIHSNRDIQFSIDENIRVNTICHAFKQHTISYIYQKIDNASSQVSRSNELFITNCNLTKWRSSFIDTISYILHAVQFTSLYISCSAMTVSTLLKIIGLLPNLNSLRVSSSPLHQLNILSNEDKENLYVISKNNKITKVWQVIDIKITEFLLALCPRMEHFEVTQVMNKDVPTIVRLILMAHIPHLSSICFQIGYVKDEMVQQLQNITDSEKLLHNYRIQRSGDRIYLQWKL